MYCNSSINTKNKNNKSALSLVEVLVVLGLVGVSMVGIAGINVRSQIAVKDNEIIDIANGIMLQSLEIAKSPSRLALSDQSGGLDVDGYYAISPDQTDTLVKMPNTDQILSTASDCDDNSNYKVALAGENMPDICMQITLVKKKRPLTDQDYYEITSRVLFRLSAGKVLNQLVAYRRGSVN